MSFGIGNAITTLKIMNVSIRPKCLLCPFVCLLLLSSVPRQSRICFVALLSSLNFLKFYKHEIIQYILFFY